MNNALHNRDCPPLMADQRHATDYRPTCYVHDLILKQNGIRNSEQMRMFLQRNSNQLRDLNLSHFNERSGCNSCQDYHVDPNGHDRYWSNYRAWLSGDDKPVASEAEAVQVQPELFQEQEEQLLGEQEAVFRGQEEEAVFRGQEEEAVFRTQEESSALEQEALARRMKHHQQMMRQRQMEIARQQQEMARMQEEEMARMGEEEHMGRF